MDESELLALIASGESATVEFKREIERPERLAREIVALANAKGGYVFLGVDDDGSIHGVLLGPDYEEWVTHIGAESIDPPLPLSCTALEIEGKTVLAIKVPAGPDKPHAVKEGQHKFTVYARYGPTTRPASREAILRLYQDSGRILYDAMPVKGATLADLDRDKIERYFWQETGQHLDELPIPLETLLLNLNVLAEKEGETLATVTGLLIFGKEPQRFLPQCELRLARFEGNELGADWIDRLEVAETLPEAIDIALKFVRRNTRLSSRIASLKREDIPEYLEPVVREAITNAVTHRDYSLYGSNIRVFIFDNRIEVRSPGELPGSLTVEKIRFGAQYSRNPNIFFFLKAMGYGDRHGTGIPRMIRRCREEGIREPEFVELNGDFVVTIFSRYYQEQ